MEHQRSTTEPGAEPARCAHCHQPIVVSAPDSRWRGFCDMCARHLAGRTRHLESA
ncbi:MAG: hypothetical protein ACTHNU_18260 [Gaiellales bacterium]